LVIEIENKKMPKRGYAIVALGKIKDSRALPVLEKIMNDKTEKIITKCDALRAIWHIDSKLGEEHAKKYGGDKGYIDRTIELLKQGAI
jgi:HEAT repeat protein